MLGPAVMRFQQCVPRLLVLATLTAGLPLACDDDDDDDRRVVPLPALPDAGGAPPPTAPPPPPPVVEDGGADAGDDGGIRSDAQIMHVLATANTGEVEQGTLASSKATDPAVLSFAQRMVTEHTAGNQRGQTLAQAKGLTPADNPTSQQLKSESDAIVAQLQPLTGAAFDAAYIDSQVTVHTKVLALIDEVLLPAATDPDVRTELTTTRGHVATHLSEAQAIKEAVAADGGS